tara:strand:- start:22 stop:414 length:393 start_codon:yes stop_codon:yes gene_type:complete
MLRFIFLVLLFIFSSCSYNELITGCTNPTASNYDQNATIDNGLCVLDICLSEPTFLECVKPIIDNNCVSCHSYGGDAGDILLTDYNLIIEADNMYDIINSINNTMPKGGLMPQKNINVIEKWFENGAPNN